MRKWNLRKARHDVMEWEKCVRVEKLDVRIRIITGRFRSIRNSLRGLCRMFRSIRDSLRGPCRNI